MPDYHENLCCIEKNRDNSIYKIRNADGTMYCQEIIPGVQITYNDFYTMEQLPVHEKNEDLMEMNYCLAGSHRCIQADAEDTVFEENNFTIHIYREKTKNSYFPEGRYRGIGIYADIKLANQSVNKEFPSMQIDLNSIVERLNLKNKDFLLRSNQFISRIFFTIDDLAQNGMCPVHLLQIKFLELLLLLKSGGITGEMQSESSSDYYLAGKIRKIKKEITERYEEHVTIESLAEKYSISKTALKSGFRKMYGCPVYRHIKEYRMQKAAEMLKESNKSIDYIAGAVGYKSASKFSSAFRDIMGVSPRTFRKK